MHEDSKSLGPYWAAIAAPQPASRPRLAEDLEADVVVIGGGIVGLTAAEALARMGKSVVVLEALRIGTQATGRSTAKISAQHGLAYSRLVRDFDEQAARVYGQANQGAIDHIETLVERGRIACGIERKSAYAYAHSADAVEAVKDEASVVARLGLPAQLTRDIPAPVPASLALRFDNQAQFNPVQYLAGLADMIAPSARLFEMTRVEAIHKTSDGRSCRVLVEGGHHVDASDVIVATHLPMVSEGMLYAKAYPFSHPLLAGRIDPDRAPDGMFISVDSPSRSFRTDASGDTLHLVAVGASYATGDTNGEAQSLGELEEFVRSHFGMGASDWRWTNMDFRSMDGLPFIGPASTSAPQVHVATGFNAWGITNGTLAGTLLADQVAGRKNPYSALFDPGRPKRFAAGAEFVKANAGNARHLVGDRLRVRRQHDLDLQPGQATVATLDGDSVAAYRDDAGVLHAVSAVCTHMGCIVGWNATDRSWDCPCHGSRFAPDGAVLHGPAVTPLKEVSLAGRD